MGTIDRILISCFAISISASGVATAAELTATAPPNAIVGIDISNSQIPADSPAGSKIGSLSVRMSDGKPFRGELNAYASTPQCKLTSKTLPADLITTRPVSPGHFPCIVAANQTSAAFSPFVATFAIQVKAVTPPPPNSTVGLLSHPPGSNYFTTPDGKPVLLTGSHTWNNFQDEGSTFPPGAFDFTAYINWMQSNKFNFMRLWNIAEQPYSAPWAAVWYIDPQPYARTGPGNAADGKPKFDLTKLNQAYFDRMRARAIAAGQKGIYVGVMLLEGWSLDSKGQIANPWPYHPFNAANNVNGINGDPANTGNGDTIQTTSESPAILAAQQAYVRKVIDTVGDLDNVLYEISNESDPSSVPWQYNMINYVKNYEAGKAKQHPVGMTVPFPGGANSQVFNSPADWVSPNPGDGYGDSPPANNGAKVVLNDTDHIRGAGGSADWVWKSFTRGLNPIFMDDLGQTGVNIGGRTAFFDSAWYTTRAGMTQVAGYAAKLDLKKAKPHGELTSTSYALADPCAQYLVYGMGGAFTVDLSACSGIAFDASWTDQSGKAYPAAAVTGGTNASLTPPFSGPSVLLLTKSNVVPPPPVISADGTVLQGGATGSLVTPLGTWTFGAPAEPGMWDILLNGSSIGRGAKMEVAQGGKLFAIGSDNNWWIVTASGWTRASDPNVQPPPPPPPPPPPTPLPPGNSMLLQNPNSAAASNYPWQVGRPFVCSEIAHYPQVVINGTPIQTQAEVKNRCPDGSVKYAVISAVIPSLPPGTPQIVTLQDQPSGNTASADPLTQFPDFDATIELTKPASITGSIETNQATWQAIKNATLSLVVDGITYTIGPLDLSTQPNIAYASRWIRSELGLKKVPVTLGVSTTQAFLSGGRTLSLARPATGTDIGPLLFKSAVTTAPPSAPVSVSARKMLTDGNCKPWTSGPVEVVLQCRDFSAKRTYSLDPTGNGWKPFDPEFELSFWPATKQVQIRYIGNVTNSMALETFTADVKLTAGTASPQVVYQQAAVPHSTKTRWSRSTWIGGAPEPKININYNIGYLASTKYIWNFDPSLRIPEDVLSGAYASWQGTDHGSILSPGWWMLYMPNVGYHADIGPMPVHYNRALYSGDWRMREIMLGQADLVGAFPMHLREGDPARFTTRAKTTSALGLPVTQYVRPYSRSSDQIITHSPADISGYDDDLYSHNDWVPDTAHQPDPFSVPYILTGDPFYLEGGQLWAGTDTSSAEGPYVLNEMSGQSRAQAWVLRNIVNGWGLSPDADPMRAAFHDALDDTFASWEGERGITGTKYQGTIPWTMMNQRIGVNDIWLNLGPSPLHFWNYTGSPDEAAGMPVFNQAVVERDSAGWAVNFILYAMSQADEMGFDGVRPILVWLGQHLVQQLSDPSYGLALAGNYREPVTKKGPNGQPAHFANWAEARTAWAPAFLAQVDAWNAEALVYWPAIGTEIYWDVARGAMGTIADKVPNGMIGWQASEDYIRQMVTHTGQAPNWNWDPTWAILPRVK